MKKIDAETKFENIDYVDYPYIGIGEKEKRRLIGDEELEKIIGG